jgi:hypothetical protein
MPSTTKGLPYPGNLDQPAGPLQIQQLAQAVDTALPGAWVTIVSSAPTYGPAIPSTSWATLTDYAGATVTVPSGRTLDIEFKAPFVTAGVNSRVDTRLKVGSSYLDSATIVSAGTDAQNSAKMILTASVVGTGAGVAVSVEAIRVGNAEIKGNGIVGPSLRYRIV